MMKINPLVEKLLAHGVEIPAPFAVEIGAEVDPRRIAPGSVLHAGTRLGGERLSIGPGCVLGAEAPVTVLDCQLSRAVELKGGFFSGAVFLDGSGMGSAAHVRPGTLLEEQASGAHAVGLKQTILLPFVTLGSLINFCDVLMAGGTDRKNHSEVGSSYIHFNFTPHQDKATPSLIGDVPRGVLLNQPPVFLGGQGGLAGPCRVEYGTVLAAGSVCRKDITESGQLCVPPPIRPLMAQYDPQVYKDINRTVTNNLIYIGNILALRAWYEVVRSRFMRRDEYDAACLQGAADVLDQVLQERLKRMRDLAEKMKCSVERLNAAKADFSKLVAQQERLICLWPQMEESILADEEGGVDFDARDRLITELDGLPADLAYLDAVRRLDPQTAEAARLWLQSMVDETLRLWLDAEHGV
jgi:UDP-N-acetylglucosamine/UDP-N-acetylgalactosamine diphosphorylase